MSRAQQLLQSLGKTSVSEERELFSKDVALGTVSIIVTDNERLAVKLVNVAGEHIGMIFTSLDGLNGMYRRFTDELLTNKELADIKSKV